MSILNRPHVKFIALAITLLTTVVSIVWWAGYAQKVSQKNAEAIFTTFFEQCDTENADDPAAMYTVHTDTCDKLDRGLILPQDLVKHYCVADWHVLIFGRVGPQDELAPIAVQVAIDNGSPLIIKQTAIRAIDPAFSKKGYGFLWSWFHQGVILSPDALPVGDHTLEVTFIKVD